MKLAKLALATMVAAALAAPATAETVITSAVSRATFRLDTREGPFESDGTETLAFSTLWHGTDDSSVEILANGETVAQGLSGESDYVWHATFNGTNVLTHVTVGVDNVPETATFVVRCLYPDPEPTLRWKYAKNANGWFCAQVAIPWHAGYGAALSNMRLLFADRFEDEEALVVIETLDDEQTAYFQTDRMVKMVGQEDGRNYYLKLEDGDVFSEEFLRNGYKEHLGDPEAKPDTYLDGMEASSLSDFGSTLGADDFWNEDGVLNNSGTSYSPMVTVDGRGITLRFAAARRGLGRTTAYLVDPATVAAPLGSTETYRDVEYRAAPIDLDDFSNLAGGERAVFGVSDETMDSPLASVPKTERKICLRVANRQITSVETLNSRIAWLVWEEGGRTNFLPLVAGWTPAQTTAAGTAAATGGQSSGAFVVPAGTVAAAVHPSASDIRRSVLSAPLSPGELNLSESFGLPPAAVAKAKVTCRISTTEIGSDGSVTGTFDIAAKDAVRIVAESGEISDGVAFTVLGAASLGGPFAPLDPAACGVELLSRKAPYAFRVKAPGDYSFFRVCLAAEDKYE